MLNLEAEYDALTSSLFPAGSPERIDVVYLSLYDFEEFYGKGVRAGYIALGSAPGTKYGRRGLLVISEYADRHASGLAYLLIEQSMPDAPLWLRDGLADYVETLQFGNAASGGRVACLGRPNQRRLFTAQTSKTLVTMRTTVSQIGFERRALVPMRDLFERTWEQSRAELDAYTNSARAVLDLAAFGPSGSPARLQELMDATKSGGSADVVPTMLAGSLEALDQAVVDHEKATAQRGPDGGRGNCPLPFPLQHGNPVQTRLEAVGGVPSADMQPLLALLRRLPVIDRHHGEWYPREILERP